MAIDTFLAAVDEPDFRYHEQWLRLATLDRALALAGRAAGAARSRDRSRRGVEGSA